MKIALVLAVCVFFTLCNSQSYSFVSNALGSSMVLQRAPQRAQLWGWSKQAGSTVNVAFNGKTYTAQSSDKGAWKVFLDATQAGGPHTITITSSAEESQTLEDVLFGDVWVCGGQSNMQFTVASAFNATEEIKKAANYPNVRVFTVGQHTESPTPLLELETISQNWTRASPASIGAGQWSEFSAACWFFGRDLYDSTNVPQGLFSDNWGGTIVQAWSSPEALAQCKTGEVGAANDPSHLWNAMIVPILPMTIKGAIWYQGESNTGEQNYYACAFPQMIIDWRKQWGGETAKDFPFFFVQLAPWIGNNDAEALIRLAQMYATALPNVGVATAIDAGDPSAPYGSVHPRRKQIVGERLSLVARGMAYGQKVQYLGPEFQDWKVTDSPVAQVQITFKPESIGSGLVKVDNKCDAGVPAEQCSTFQIGTSDGKWTEAFYTISGNTVIVTGPANIPSKDVTGVRYAWATYPVATIYNKEGLPLLPFAVPNPIKPVTL